MGSEHKYERLRDKPLLCPVCGQWHKPSEKCEINEENARLVVDRALKDRKRVLDKAYKAKLRADKFEGKCAILRHENNKLRRKLKKELDKNSNL